MPIHVICPTCHARFKVGDQHAGKTGACPKCKGQIQIPAAGEEVVIHTPEMEAGAKDATGRNVLKPIRRKEAKFSLNTTLAAVGGVLLALAIAFTAGRVTLDSSQLTAFLAVGAVLLGPPLAYAGYSFLRDDEKIPFVEKDLLVRCLGAGLAYAAAWGAYWWVKYQLHGSNSELTEPLELFQLGVLMIPVLVVGVLTAFVAFDFDPLTAFFHFALYFGTTVLLRFIMGLDLLPGMSATAPPLP